MNALSLKKDLAILLLLPFLAGIGPGMARDHHHGPPRAREPVWHGEIGRFHENDFERWRGGRWHHGRHLERIGWWWIVGPAWYFYPARIDPYPNPYQPSAGPAPRGPVERPYWYYCARPAGYYPYVARCTVRWQRVEASP